MDRQKPDFESDPTYKKVPKNFSEVLDDSAHMLFLTEVARGMWYTLGAFFDKKVTVSGQGDVDELGSMPHARARMQVELTLHPPAFSMHARRSCTHSRRVSGGKQ